MKKVTIDGYRLSFPATGLGLVSAELLRGFQEIGYAKSIAVFVEKSFNPSGFELNDLEVEWIPIDFKLHSPDYLGRLAWGVAIAQKLKKLGSDYRHFIPYFYNYGNSRENVVLVPDLIFKMSFIDTTQDPNKPWWNWRGRLPFRAMFNRWGDRKVTKAKRLVVYTEFVKSHVHQELGVPLSKMAIMQHPRPSWNISKYQEIHNAVVQSKFNLPARFILYVGGFAVRKNLPMLLRTCGKIYEIDPSFRCVFVGLTEQVIQTDWGIRESLKNDSVRAASVALPNLDYQDLASLYRLAEFIVYPSLSEGFGLPILEAAAAKKLCLCGDNSSMREVQTNPQYRISSDDQTAWFEKILYFWQNAEASNKAGAACERLFQQYDSLKSAEQLWHILQS